MTNRYIILSQFEICYFDIDTAANK